MIIAQKMAEIDQYSTRVFSTTLLLHGECTFKRSKNENLQGRVWALHRVCSLLMGAPGTILWHAVDAVHMQPCANLNRSGQKTPSVRCILTSFKIALILGNAAIASFPSKSLA